MEEWGWGWGWGYYDQSYCSTDSVVRWLKTDSVDSFGMHWQSWIHSWRTFDIKVLWRNTLIRGIKKARALRLTISFPLKVYRWLIVLNKNKSRIVNNPQSKSSPVIYIYLPSSTWPIDHWRRTHVGNGVEKHLQQCDKTVHNIRYQKMQSCNAVESAVMNTRLDVASISSDNLLRYDGNACDEATE